MECAKLFSKDTFQTTDFDFTEDSSNVKSLENYLSSFQIQSLNIAKKEFK